jgi:hypothetical protein
MSNHKYAAEFREETVRQVLERPLLNPQFLTGFDDSFICLQNVRIAPLQKQERWLEWIQRKT